MAFKMKGYSYPGKSPLMNKTDLRKKSGFGPRAAEGEDDQSKELAKSRYEMGEYKNDPTRTGSQIEKYEDAKGVGKGSNRKVMKDGYVNPTQKAKIKKERDRYNALTPAQKKAEQDAANDKADKFHKRGKYAKKK